MIQRTFTEDIKPTPRELERELCENMDETEQADFLLALSQRYKNEFSNVVMQYEYIKDQMHFVLNKNELANVINMLKTLIEYLELDEEE